MADIIKQSGRRPTEQFNRDKLHRSIQAACLSVRTPEGEAHTIANSVSSAVITWIEEKAAVTSEDIRRVASAALETFHPEAAYLYQHHRLVI